MQTVVPTGAVPVRINRNCVCSNLALSVLARDGPAKRSFSQGRGDCGWPRHNMLYYNIVSAEGARRFLRTVSAMFGALLYVIP
jgi:hypothetical protein